VAGVAMMTCRDCGSTRVALVMVWKCLDCGSGSVRWQRFKGTWT